MTSFLQLVAKDLYTRCNGDLSDVLVIFPSIRARLYFTQHIGNLVEKPTWLPQFSSLSETMQKISGLKLADSLELVFRLHSIYCKTRQIQQEFDEFHFWGEMMLADFDEVDKYRVDAIDLFRNLAEWKSMRDQFDYLTPEQIAAIEQFWGTFRSGKFSEHQQEFMQVWAALGQVYKELREQLLFQGEGYEGFISRSAVEKLEAGADPFADYKHVVVVGFHILNRCEEDLFDAIQKTGKALFYWDYDNFYVQRKHHEAGRFMLANLQRYPSALPSAHFNLLKDNVRNVELWSVPSNTGQARLLPTFLKPFISYNWEDKTAVVLGDEELLMPVLHSIPEDVETLNITMGYPLRNSSASAFVTLLLDLQESFVRFKGRLHYKSALPLLEHPYLVAHINGVSAISESIRRENRIFMNPKEVADKQELLAAVFQPSGEGRGLTDYLTRVLSGFLACLQRDQKNESLVEAEFIFRILLAVRRIDDLLLRTNQTLKSATLMRLLRKILAGLSVPFSGEPLGGLQVMGLLETRTLDFENLIILSANEGVLPKTTVAPSFIPYSLRKGFGITTIEHQDSIYAYYFYRLLQRAKNVTLVYNANPVGSRSGEMSRFVQQLLVETNWTITRREAPYTLRLPADIPLVAPRNEKTKELLMRYQRSINDGGHYLSPSALSSWFSCSLKFYFAHLAQIRVPDELTPDVDSAIFGNIFHKAMELLYEPLVGEEVRKADFNTLLNNKPLINKAIESAFASEFFRFRGKDEQPEFHGNNIVIRDVLQQYVERLISLDRDQSPITLVEMERKEIFSFPIITDNGTTTINIGGRIDRIDRRNGVERVIDYKTGFSSKNSLSAKTVESLFVCHDEKRPDYVFQAMFYAMLLAEAKSGNVPEPHLFMIKDFFESDPDFRILIDSEIPGKAQVDEFKHYLAETLKNIFISDEPFKQVDNEDICKLCDYKSICHR
jgi:CRISPR/Cas system-associated exonuclease Cas4 (RecB family)